MIIGENSTRALIAIGKILESGKPVTLASVASVTYLNMRSTKRILRRLEKGKFIRIQKVSDNNFKIELSQKGWNVYKTIVNELGNLCTIDELINILDHKIISASPRGKLEIGNVIVKLSPQFRYLRIKNLMEIIELSQLSRELLSSAINLSTCLDLLLSSDLVPPENYRLFSETLFRDIVSVYRALTCSTIPAFYMRPINISLLVSRITTMYPWSIVLGETHSQRIQSLMDVLIEAKCYNLVNYKGKIPKTIIYPQGSIGKLINRSSDVSLKLLIRSSNKYQWILALIYHELTMNSPLAYEELYSPPKGTMLRLLKEILESDYITIVERFVISGKRSILNLRCKHLNIGRAVIRGLATLYRIRGENYIVPLIMGRSLLWRGISTQDPYELAKMFIDRISKVITDKGTYGKIIKLVIHLGITTIDELRNKLRIYENLSLSKEDIIKALKLLVVQGAIQLSGKELDIVYSPWLMNPLTIESRSSLYKPLLDVLWYEVRDIHRICIEALRVLVMRNMVEIPKVIPSSKDVLGSNPSNFLAFVISAYVIGTSPNCGGRYLIFAFLPNSLSINEITYFNSIGLELPILNISKLKFLFNALIIASTTSSTYV